MKITVIQDDDVFVSDTLLSRLNEDFLNPNLLDVHWTEHGKQFPTCKTPEQYQDLANRLVKTPVKGTYSKDAAVVGYKRHVKGKQDTIVKYFVKNNIFIIYIPNWDGKEPGIITIYRPKTGAEYYDNEIEKDKQKGIFKPLKY